MEAAGTRFCTECGAPTAADDLFTFGNHHVCLRCKPAFAQRLRQGGAIAAGPQRWQYGGFWIRFLARIIDGIILGVIAFAVNMILGLSMGFGSGPRQDPSYAMALGSASIVVDIAIAILYEAGFLVRNGATPGKMLLGLKVVTADGGPISWGRAIARYFGYWLDSLTLLIGYIIAAFDSEKRALHDHICDTRVIRVATEQQPVLAS